MDIRSSVSDSPNPVAEEQFRKGFEQAKAGNLDDAILSIEAALAVSPEEGRYHDLLGTLYAKKGMYELAVSEWKRSIECDPAHAEVFRRIETAEKLKTQEAAGGARLNGWVIGALAVCFVVSTAWATYQTRARSADKTRLTELETLAAQVEERMVEKTAYEALQTEHEKLKQTLADQKAALSRLEKEAAQLRSRDHFVPKAEYDRERELRNRIQDELAALRKEFESLKKENETLQSASAVEEVQAELEQKEQRIALLNDNYKQLNLERNRLEKELLDSRNQIARLNDVIEDLEEQAVEMVSATESRRLKTRIAELEEQLARTRSGSAVATADVREDTEVLFYLNSSFEAVRHVLDGDRTSALAALKRVGKKVPENKRLADLISRLESVPETRQEAATPTPTPRPPAPTATQAPPERRPTPVPTRRRVRRPTPTPKAAVAASERQPSEPPGVAVPKPIPPRKSRSIQPARSGEPAKSAPRVRRPARTSEQPSRQQRLFQRKKELTDRAYRLYKARRFEEAAHVIDQARRIDPKDPRVNQLRTYIYKHLKQ